jgi:hypothetical protein
MFLLFISCLLPGIVKSYVLQVLYILFAFFSWSVSGMIAMSICGALLRLAILRRLPPT